MTDCASPARSGAEQPGQRTSDTFADVGEFLGLARVTGLCLSVDGSRLVAVVQQLDDDGARYVSSLWDVDPGGRAPATRLTRSAKGETSPAFLPDGSLLFVSARADAANDDDETALWVLPTVGEPRVAVRSPGGVSEPQVASASGVVLVSASRLVDSVDEDDDRTRRQQRKDRKISAILHSGMPVRDWDHEVGDVSRRLLVADRLTGGGEPAADWRDLTADAGLALTGASYSISAEGTTVATTWRRRERGGRTAQGIELIDVASGRRTRLALDAAASYESPRVSPDGRALAVVRESEGSFEEPAQRCLLVLRLGTDTPPWRVDVGDLEPREWVWSADSVRLFVAGDLGGHGPVVAVDVRDGQLSRLTAEGAYSELCPSPDGQYLYALRSAIDSPPAPVRLAVALEGGPGVVLRSLAPPPEVPGRLTDVDVAVGNARVRGWLCTPDQAEPAPLLVFIHGGPFLSSNAWSWRWNPWVAVARGYAVLLPDPALSTGYGAEFIARAWPHRAAVVWADIEALVDRVLENPAVDASRTACLGGSFGGYMTNWVAGHTDRFDAIVTHAGLWALDQQHATTDAAYWKSSTFGTPAEHPQWYAENSPHNFVDSVRTPMLVSHGNRDYRVPVSEALRLWWDLVSRFDGEPDELPHRFLNFTTENHWVLAPANAQIWYETVLGFCDRHVRSQKPR